MTGALVHAHPIDPDAHVQALIEAWLSGHASEHTVAAYRRDLKMWIEWCRDNDDIDPLAARHAYVRTWLTDRIKEGDSEATRARRLAAVSGWYRTLVREGTVPFNPADLAAKERPVVDKRRSPTMALSADNAILLLRTADDDASPRSAAIVSLLLYDGLRIAELAAADVSNLESGSGHPLLTVHGKGRRKRVVPVPPPAFARWQRYHHWRLDRTDLLPALVAEAGPSRPLVTTSAGTRIGQPEAWRLLQRLGRRARMDDSVVKRLSPHVLRHTCATILLDGGVPLRDVQYFLGHADAATTERYDHGELTAERSPTYKLMALLGVD